MPVIKGDGTAEAPAERERSGGARLVRAGVVDAEVYDARQAAALILEEAHRRADALLEEARRERERLLAEAREAGRQEGLAQATEVLLRARLQAQQTVAAAEGDIVELACRVAERIIGRDLEREPELVVDICARALAELRQVRQMVLRVHPQDAAILRARSQRFLEGLGRTAEVAVKEDPEVQRGGCVVQTEFGTVDAQLATQFDVLRRVLLEGGAEGEG
jgi:type III secretion protein L